jgi:hypothetical protein
MKNFERLNKNEMKMIVGGSGDCRVAIRNADGSFRGWTARNYDVDVAQDAFGDTSMFSDGSYVSGYCCASCPF